VAVVQIEAVADEVLVGTTKRCTGPGDRRRAAVGTSSSVADREEAGRPQREQLAQVVQRHQAVVDHVLDERHGAHCVRRRPRVCEVSAAAASASSLPRPRVRRLRRLHRPGNFATNIAGGSKFGYTLVWVIVAANLMAMLIQTLSAKLGIAPGTTARGLPRAILQADVLRALDPSRVDRDGDRPRGVPRRGARLSPAARIDLFPAAILTAIAAFLILGLQRFGFRPFEAVIAAIVGMIGVCYLGELSMRSLRSAPSPSTRSCPSSRAASPSCWRSESSARP